jgi:hypothetical protein
VSCSVSPTWPTLMPASCSSPTAPCTGAGSARRRTTSATTGSPRRTSPAFG